MGCDQRESESEDSGEGNSFHSKGQKAKHSVVVFVQFRGSGVNPFIFNILPGTPNPPSEEVLHQFHQKLKIGYLFRVNELLGF